MIPFLFTAFLIVEIMEHYSGNKIGKFLGSVGKAGPVIGAIAGCLPQCGFSVMAANLYAGGVITVGTLIATFIATSDEAILIMMGNPGREKEILLLILCKIVIGILAGFAVNIFLKNKVAVPKECGEICKDCGCKEENAGVLKPAIRHTIKVYAYLLIFTILLDVVIDVIGIENLSQFLLADTIFQPVMAAVIGLIPNCAASVVLVQLFLNGAISFASVVAGLCSGAGAGLIVLFKVNENKRETMKIIGLLLGIACLAGIVLEIIWVL